MKRKPIKIKSVVSDHCECKHPELIATPTMNNVTKKWFRFCKKCNKNRWIEIERVNE